MTFFKKIKESIQVFFDLFVTIKNGNATKVDPAIQKERIKICAACPELIKKTGQCGKCGCIVNMKTQYADESCPIDKWSAIS
jgi:hypothetical protein